MKNAFKLSLLAPAVAITMAACTGGGTGNSADSSKNSAKVDSSSSMKSSTDTTIHADSIKATDTSKAKLDTTSKTVTKHTEVKKVVKKS